MNAVVTPARTAAVYAAVSVVLGPLLLVGSYALFTRGGGDVCDAVYLRPDGTVDPSRDAEFATAHLFRTIGAAVLGIAGLALLVWFAFRPDALRRPSGVLAVAVVLVVLAGYAVVGQFGGPAPLDGC